jgi:hypothetical protein
MSDHEQARLFPQNHDKEVYTDIKLDSELLLGGQQLTNSQPVSRKWIWLLYYILLLLSNLVIFATYSYPYDQKGYLEETLA